MGYNELLGEAGSFGLYQKCLVAGFLVPSIIMATFACWTQVFILIVPPYRCKINPEDNVWHLWPQSNFTLNEAFVEAHKCDGQIVYASEYKTKSLDTFENRRILNSGNQQNDAAIRNSSCQYGYVYDFRLLYPTIATEGNYVCENAWKMYVVHTCYYIGSMLSFLIFGSISDRCGRKRAYQGSVLVILCADIATYFATNHSFVLIARLLSAVGAGNIGTLCFVLTIECTGPERRLLCLAIWSMTITFTATAYPWITYAVHHWQYVLAISWMPTLICLLSSSFVPESISWLVARGRLEEAAAQIQRLAKVNGKDLNLDHIKEELIKEKKSSAIISSSATSKDQSASSNISDGNEAPQMVELGFFQSTLGLCKTPNLRKKTILLCIIWMITQMCYNGNSLEISKLPFNLYLLYSVGSIIELSTNIICLFLLDRIGRRWANTAFLVIGGTLSIIAGGTTRDPVAIFVLSIFVRMCFTGGFDVSMTFSNETFPTVVRGRGNAIIRLFGGITSAVAPFVVALSERDPLLPMLVFGVLSVFAGLTNLLLPETAGQHLPQTLEDGEEFGKNQSFFNCPFSQTKYDVRKVESSFHEGKCQQIFDNEKF